MFQNICTQLIDTVKRYTMVKSVQDKLIWDSATIMPHKAAFIYGKQQGVLEEMKHTLTRDIGRLLAAVEETVLTAHQKRNIELISR